MPVSGKSRKSVGALTWHESCLVDEEKELVAADNHAYIGATTWCQQEFCRSMSGFEVLYIRNVAAFRDVTFETNLRGCFPENGEKLMLFSMIRRRRCSYYYYCFCIAMRVRSCIPKFVDPRYFVVNSPTWGMSYAAIMIWSTELLVDVQRRHIIWFLLSIADCRTCVNEGYPKCRDRQARAYFLWRELCLRSNICR